MIGLDYLDESLVHKYIIWHKKIRSISYSNINQFDNALILKIQFEDLVNNYQLIKEKICSFLDINAPNSQFESYFNIKTSEKNIGIWKKWINQKDIDAINKNLIA